MLQICTSSSRARVHPAAAAVAPLSIDHVPKTNCTKCVQYDQLQRSSASRVARFVWTAPEQSCAKLACTELSSKACR